MGVRFPRLLILVQRQWVLWLFAAFFDPWRIRISPKVFFRIT